MGEEGETPDRDPKTRIRSRSSAEKEVDAIPIVRGHPEPADSYFTAWLLIRDAEKETGSERLVKLKQAYGIFRGVQEEHLKWKAEMVEARVADTRNRLLAELDSADQSE